jgi:NTP pyrophosphatase (non-canonical NTP hydrolase)
MLDKLEQLIERESNKLLEQYYDTQIDHDKVIKLARMVKLQEECGELADEVLSSVGLQRKSKLSEFNDVKLDKELADVQITLLVLAKSYNKDIIKLVEKRLMEIDARRNIE